MMVAQLLEHGFALPAMRVQKVQQPRKADKIPSVIEQSRLAQTSSPHHVCSPNQGLPARCALRFKSL